MHANVLSRLPDCEPMMNRPSTGVCKVSTHVKLHHLCTSLGCIERLSLDDLKVQASTWFNRHIISDMFWFVAFSISLCLSQARQIHFVCFSGWEWIAVFDDFWISLMLSCLAVLQCGVSSCESVGCRNSAVPPSERPSLLATQGCAIPMCLLHERRYAAWDATAISHTWLQSSLCQLANPWKICKQTGIWPLAQINHNMLSAHPWVDD